MFLQNKLSTSISLGSKINLNAFDAQLFLNIFLFNVGSQIFNAFIDDSNPSEYSRCPPMNPIHR